MTLVELLVVISILILIAALSLPGLLSFDKETSLNNSFGEIVNALKLAQARALSSEGLSEWGVQFSLAPSSKYTIFKGVDFDSRDTNYDEVFDLPSGIVFTSWNFSDGGDEIVFNQISGFTNQQGSVVLAIASNPVKSRSFFIDVFGAISSQLPVACDDSVRLKDSRHTHFVYSRTIDTTTEKIILTFDGGTQKTIVIADNMQAGQIFWQGEVDVAGQKQVITLHTHRLNSSDTEFCAHRLGTENSKAVKIDIDGDPLYPASSPTLIYFGQNGSTLKGNSVFVDQPIWQ